MSPVLQLVLLPSLAHTQSGLALPVQLIMEVVQQCSSCSALESVHTNTHASHAEKHLAADYVVDFGQS